MSEKEENEVETGESDSASRPSLLGHLSVFDRTLIAAWVGMVVFTFLIDPALAQTTTASNGQAVSQNCDGPILTTVQNGTLWLTAAGPTVGTLWAGRNMLGAAATNKSSKKKEYKSNIRDALMYGFGLGMLTGIVNLLTSFGPMATC